MIHLAIGRQGSGKTLFLVMNAMDNYRRKKQVYSNIHLNFPYRTLKYMDIIKCKLRNCLVVLDEIHLLLSARRWQSKVNVEICDNFLSMARKQETDIIGSTQTLRKVDVRFKEEADYIHYCTKYVYDYRNTKWLEVLHTKPFPKDVPILIEVNSQETYSGKRSNFHFIGNDWFNYYDTTQIVKVEGLPEKYAPK